VKSLLDSQVRAKKKPVRPPGRSRPRNGRRHTAIHEAGHAVIGRALGIPCGHVTIEADADSSGHGIVPDPWVILEAWWATEGKSHRDMAAVMRAEDEHPARVQRLRRLARMLVRRHRPAIERMAERLLKRGRLTQGQADRTMGKVAREALSVMRKALAERRATGLF